MSADTDMRRIAEAQHGVVSWDQARASVTSDRHLRRRLAGPDWELATPRVLRLVGAPQTERQLIMTAVLDGGPGTVASHFSAAALWRLPAFSGGGVETSRPRGLNGRPPATGRTHWPRSLPAHHTTVVDGVPVTTLARTLFDLAGRLKPARVARLVDTVSASSPAMIAALHRLLEELAGRGRNGVGVMRAILEDRPVGYIPMTGLEARFHDIVASAGLPPMRRQVDLGGDEWIGRIDFVDDEGTLVEIDSARHHLSVLDRERDRLRDEALRAAGYKHILRFTDDQVWRRPDEVRATLWRERRMRSPHRFGTSKGA